VYNLRNYVMVRSSDSVLDASCSADRRRHSTTGGSGSAAIQARGGMARSGAGGGRLEPYSDGRANRLITTPPERIKSVAVRALKAGFSSQRPRDRDRANRIVLDQFEAALREVPTADHASASSMTQILRYQDIHASRSST